MIKNKIVFFLVILLLYSCRVQNIKIVINDNSADKIKVWSISKNDTTALAESQPNYYILKNKLPQIILISYQQKRYIIRNIDSETKSILIDYKKNADNDCYVIHKVYSDAIQSYGLNSLKKCKSITNIYIYNEYNPVKNNKPSIKIRIKN